MELTVIGTGNLGTNLTHALQQAGHEVTSLHGRTFRPEDIRGDIVILSVKDDALPLVASRIAHTDCLVLHTAGSQPLDVLKSPRRGVLYPMQTFSKSRLVPFDEIPVFIESDTDIDLLETLARTLSRNVRQLSSDQRRYLHLAAVFACNFANHCYDLAARLLTEHGIPFEVMLPLIDETARKVHRLTPQEAQTGPAVRYDKTIIEQQENLLTGDAKDIYRLMSTSIHKHHDKL